MERSFESIRNPLFHFFEVTARLRIIYDRSFVNSRFHVTIAFSAFLSFFLFLVRHQPNHLFFFPVRQSDGRPSSSADTRNRESRASGCQSERSAGASSGPASRHRHALQSQAWQSRCEPVALSVGMRAVVSPGGHRQSSQSRCGALSSPVAVCGPKICGARKLPGPAFSPNQKYQKKMTCFCHTFCNLPAQKKDVSIQKYIFFLNYKKLCAAPPEPAALRTYERTPIP